jgi:hypothetical protein
MDNPGILTGPISLFFLTLSVLLMAFFVVFWAFIYDKAGYPHHWIRGILMAVPPINLVLFLMFVFGSWPIISELESMQTKNTQKEE